MFEFWSTIGKQLNTADFDTRWFLPVILPECLNKAKLKFRLRNAFPSQEAIKHNAGPLFCQGTTHTLWKDVLEGSEYFPLFSALTHQWSFTRHSISITDGVPEFIFWRSRTPLRSHWMREGKNVLKKGDAWAYSGKVVTFFCERGKACASKINIEGMKGPSQRNFVKMIF